MTRTKGKDVFVAPGGKVEAGENAQSALKRERKEELNIDIDTEKLEVFWTFYAQAAGQEHKRLQMDVFVVPEWSGTITPTSEVEEVLWINATPPDINIGLVFQCEVLPRLKQQGLID